MNSIGKLFVLTFVVLFGLSKAQVNPTYTVFSGSLQGVNSSAIDPANTIILPVTNKANYLATVLRESNKSAKLYLKLDAGNDYVKSNSATWIFTATVIFDYKFVTSGPSYQRTLSINNTSPELLKIDDVLSNFVAPTQGFTLTVISVDLKDGANANITSGILYDFLSNNLRLSASLHREYNVDVRLAGSNLMSSKPYINPVVISGRLVTFSWQPAVSVQYPNYELQVLKLYNTDELYKNDLNQMKTTVNWSNALKVETQSHQTSIKLTMAEGTGYYIWRVRPIGTYFPGGAANSENYGEWSHCVNSGTISLNKNTLLTNNPDLYAFYMTDPDEDINWIYNRVFTEGDDYNKVSPTGLKSSEGMTYADGLQRVRQSQKYNSSEETKLISQTVSDYSGRAALNSIPTPVPGSIDGYKTNFLQNTSNELYTAKHFDEDIKLDDPDKIQDYNTSYSYYSDYPTVGSINNSNVPDAQGYPFKRTLYKNDGSNRVVEESGIGKTHALGTQTSGRGRTTRIFYGVPSDDELIRIFGDEAPQSESVIKTTTIDQNNVVSVSYTSKEGKTIATAMSSYTTENLSALSGTVPLRSITNAINQNVSAGGKIVASKRISIIDDNTTVYLSYTTENLPMATAGCLSAGCNYEMRFYMVDLQTNKTYMSDADITNTAVTNFTTSGDITDFPDNWGLVEVGGTATIIPGGASLQNELTLNSGEYIFIKEFYSTNSPDYAEDLANNENDKTRLILDAIAAQMQLVTNPAKRSSFGTWMSTFKDMVVDYNSMSPVFQTADFIAHLCLGGSTPPGYVFPKAPDFDIASLVPTPDDLGSSDMVISTKCCGSMKVQIPNSRICYACVGSPDEQYQGVESINTMTLTNKNAALSEITPYGLEDFENDPSWAALSMADKRYAVSEIVEREFISLLKGHMDEENMSYDDLWKITPGFSFGSLNFMITNMLISRYYTGNVIESAGSWYEAVKDEDGNFVLGSSVVDYSENYPHNYDCKTLWEGWVAAVEMEGSFELDGNDQNVIKEYDNAEGPLATLLASINTDNWPAHLKSALDFAKSAIGKVINKWSNSRDGAITPSQMAAETSVTGTFLFQVKPSYAAIIDGEQLPGYLAYATSPEFPADYFDYTGTPNPLDPPIYTSVLTGAYTHQDVPLLSDNLGNVVYNVCGGNSYPELCYPYILKPEWMFKYYVYNVFENNGTVPGTTNFIDDADYLIPNQVSTDLARCYNEPFSYLSSSITNGTLQASDLCQQTAKPTYTLGVSTSTFSFIHVNWSADERKDFYAQIKGAARCYTTKGIGLSDDYYSPPGSLPTCQTKTVLVSEAKAILAERVTQCQKMGPRIKNALIKELESSCYTIVNCASVPRVPGEITMAEIDLMVNKVISDALDLIADIDTKFSFVATNTTACVSPSLISTLSNYSDSDCDLPACSQEDCVEIFLYEDNTLGRVDNRNLTVKYFADCDQKILDMLEQGAFLPDIPPPSGVTCNKPLKAWKQCTGSTSDCSPEYEEQTGCPDSEFKRYSKEYTVTATGN